MSTLCFVLIARVIPTRTVYICYVKILNQDGNPWPGESGWIFQTCHGLQARAHHMVFVSLFAPVKATAITNPMPLRPTQRGIGLYNPRSKSLPILVLVNSPAKACLIPGALADYMKLYIRSVDEQQWICKNDNKRPYSMNGPTVNPNYSKPYELLWDPGSAHVKSEENRYATGLGWNGPTTPTPFGCHSCLQPFILPKKNWHGNFERWRRTHVSWTSGEKWCIPAHTINTKEGTQGASSTNPLRCLCRT